MCFICEKGGHISNECEDNLRLPFTCSVCGLVSHGELYCPWRNNFKNIEKKSFGNQLPVEKWKFDNPD